MRSDKERKLTEDRDSASMVRKPPTVTRFGKESDAAVIANATLPLTLLSAGKDTLVQEGQVTLKDPKIVERETKDRVVVDERVSDMPPVVTLPRRAATMPAAVTLIDPTLVSAGTCRTPAAALEAFAALTNVSTPPTVTKEVRIGVIV
jgi:hypothetical protein